MISKYLGFDSDYIIIGLSGVHYNIYKIGVCFDFQRVEHVPTEPHDIPMDEIL